jgi:hypothetical protein
MMHMRRKFGRQAMIGDPPVLTLRQNFERPTAA